MMLAAHRANGRMVIEPGLGSQPAQSRVFVLLADEPPEASPENRNEQPARVYRSDAKRTLGGADHQQATGASGGDETRFRRLLVQNVEPSQGSQICRNDET